MAVFAGNFGSYSCRNKLLFHSVVRGDPSHYAIEILCRGNSRLDELHGLSIEIHSAVCPQPVRGRGTADSLSQLWERQAVVAA